MTTPTLTPEPEPAHTPPSRRLRSDRGEGVISSAIAVLIVAFIGAAMWVAFDQIWTDAEGNIESQVGTIGS